MTLIKNELLKETLNMLNNAHIVLTQEEQQKLEITDLGLGNIEQEGIQIYTYVNTSRYCAKYRALYPLLKIHL
ncbi:hypothetical protein ACFOU2_19965 [Bacillus songklensis]|uniref:Uncharacterized protein n=1 Tax=Bacillus songklensis TaxID=1069116 RepID=A0ABV8B7W8_9BACI